VNEKLIVEYVALQKKRYALKITESADKMRCAGVTKSAIKDCNLDTYKSTLFKQTVKCVTMRNLRSYDLTMYRLVFFYHVMELRLYLLVLTRFLKGKIFP
jgi:hypothetical protein